MTTHQLGSLKMNQIKTFDKYAIFARGLKQYQAVEGKTLALDLLDGEVGSTVEFKDVLLVDDNGKVKVGAPTLSGAAVTGKILSHVRGDKVIIFKKKRRKGYQKQNGHRQDLTIVQIDSIKA